jgi:hypothetical protein
VRAKVTTGAVAAPVIAGWLVVLAIAFPHDKSGAANWLANNVFAYDAILVLRVAD